MTDFKNNFRLSLLMRFLVFLLLVTGYQTISAQQPGTGKLSGNLLDGKFKVVEGASLRLVKSNDSLTAFSSITNSTGSFSFEKLSYGFYKIRITHVSFQPLVIDSIHIREEKSEILLNDLVLHAASSGVMDEVIVYFEKPLIEVKDGNIIFNAAESPQSAGSSASELLESVPLVSKDASGNITVRGKEPRILIDDKPVELNLQQLQDLLESMPGSSIEKIEVMTNPPPQYANEQGGVINIVTRKGIVGISGRINLTYGTRNQAGLNGSFNYRKQGLSLSVVAGTGYNEFNGNGYSKRENIFTDSVNHFNTNNEYVNKSLRPNFRINLRYDINKFHELNLVVNYNQNNYDNANETEYINLNRFDEIYRLRRRMINSDGYNLNPSLNLGYNIKTKKAGETLKFFVNINSGKNRNERLFNESFLNADYTATGKDSLQQQLNDNYSRGMSIRVQYDLPFSNKKTFLSTGGFINSSRNDINAEAYFWSKSGVKWMELDALTNELVFHQKIYNLRASAKHLLSEKTSITAGLSAEQTTIDFDLVKMISNTGNRYWSYLPFATFNRNWEGIWNLSFSYRKSIRRPGIGQLNPTIDFSDPFNTRFGNPSLNPSYSHNYDVVIGRNKNDLFFNLGLGHNRVLDIFNSIRTRISSDTTQTTWQNISNKKEYEVSAWSGYKINKQLRVNFSSSYVYNVYGDYDKEFRKFRDGGSFTSNLNANYNIRDLYSASANVTYNRFANPQGNARTNVSMNIGVQGKFFDKKLVVTINSIDPFVQQRNHLFTYGTNFISENYNQTTTRNYRISIAYALRKTIRTVPKSSKEKINAVLEGS